MNPLGSYELASGQADELKKLIDSRPLSVSSEIKQAVQSFYVNALSALDKVRIFSERFDPRSSDTERWQEWSEADSAQQFLRDAANRLETVLAKFS